MSSKFRVVTNIGEKTYLNEGCYGAFNSLVRIASKGYGLNKEPMEMDQSYLILMLRGDYRYRIDEGWDNICQTLKEKGDDCIKLEAVYVGQPRDSLGYNNCTDDEWWSIYKVFKKFPATADAIITMSKKDIVSNNREIGIDLTHPNGYIIYTCLFLLRMFGEQYYPFVKYGTKLFNKIGPNRSMFFLFMIQNMCPVMMKYLRPDSEMYYPYTLRPDMYSGADMHRHSPQIKYDGLPILNSRRGHSLQCFGNGVPLQALYDIVEKGSLDYFFNAARLQRSGCKTDADLLGMINVKNISGLYSPSQHKEKAPGPFLSLSNLGAKVGTVPFTWHEEDFLKHMDNYVNFVKTSVEAA